MKKVFVFLGVLFAGILFYISCSEESSQSEDVSVEQKDIIEIKDEIITKDTEDAVGDTLEITDNLIMDEGLEVGTDTETDVAVGDEGVADVGTEDIISDTGSSPPAKIIPGTGVDIVYNSNPRQIRIGNEYLTLKDIQTSTPMEGIPFYLRCDSMHFDMLFVDTDGSKGLSDNDRLVRIVLSKDFYGETEGHTKVGDDISVAKTEFGASDHTASASVEGEEYTFDFWFKKGINVGSDRSGKITGFTIYKAQKIVPSTEIDYENFTTLGIKADLALFGGNATSISELRNRLGPEDLLTEDTDNNVNYYLYLSIGALFIESTQMLSGKVITISLFPPFFGKLKGTSLSLGSSRTDIERTFGEPKITQQGNTTIYYYPIAEKDMGISKYDYSLGFVYNQNNNVASIIVGLPVKK